MGRRRTKWVFVQSVQFTGINGARRQRRNVTEAVRGFHWQQKRNWYPIGVDPQDELAFLAFYIRTLVHM